MNDLASFSLRGRNPDVLTCIANLSNDEVFTPPALAHRMLDILADAWAADHDGADLWANPDVCFLDPCTKSGIFLREITSRLTLGLAQQMPDLQARVNHILTRQVFGIGITRLTSLLARRSVYCSKHALGEHSIGKGFGSDAGNIWFERTEHTWVNGKCSFCGASQSALDRGEGLESHAYAFIHTTDIKARIAELFGSDMQFDVIIGNPPYQLGDGGYGSSAAPIYQLFVEKALQLDPRYAVFVTPSRWMAGGKGLDAYRANMLGDKRLRSIVDYPKLYEAFPGVKIRGGVSYFLWDRNHDGQCSFQTMWDGIPTGPAVARDLDEYDVLVRRNEAIPILDKIRSKKEPTLDQRVSSQKPFGLRTFYHGKPRPTRLKQPIKLFGSQKISWIERSEIPTNDQWIDKWKILMTRVQGTSAAIETKFLSKPIIAEPLTACTESYIVAGTFDDETQARNYASYLRTRFARFLVSLRKPTQDAARGVYGFVPDLPLEEEWTDAKLYQRYGLSPEEIAFIESQVAEHDAELFDAEVTDEDVDE
ncbi:Eco57I restriction-modification methylase domain-containing protein [Ottowia sp.]|uniref:Eco57I restriction-modification methylase domain-containing protein n=1 Tax=Ottowia sp. TaxID=1898956 RepID=UPI002B73F601|nr:Eco57I restriction-modification methylase domain-containing protein [Ottowia sp.]HRN76051.1 Eco57I restriction-modification methylase domain-containing protein [Ottowia sp.]HRQ02190.1 Eco57I restriction-modification methylase domain-containing protein [Ottowia sp.]